MYAVVRHPLYLGWMLSYVVLSLFAQHWLVALVAIVGAAWVYVIVVQEERRMLARFGEEYGRYMQTVPRVNLVLALIRLLQRRRRE